MRETRVDFSEAKYKAGPEPYNALLSEIARTGVDPYSWKEIKRLVCFRSESVRDRFHPLTRRRC